MANEVKKKPHYKYVLHPALDKPYAFLQMITQEAFDDALSYKTSAEDIIVCTYPKCGTTWTIQALLIMRNGGKLPETNGLADGLFKEVPFLELATGSNLLRDIKERPRLIKTHLYFDLTPWSPEAKYIVVARNPKDCFVSFYYHTIGFKDVYEYSDGKFEDYFELIINGDVDSGDYFKCTGEWFEKSKTEPNILFLLYEDMKEDAEREFLRIADFLGTEWAEKVRENDNELLKKMVQGSSFKNMKEAGISAKGRFERPGHLPFIRKGIVGDWKTLFTKEQSTRVDKRMKEAGEKYPGFDHLWDKYSEYLT